MISALDKKLLRDLWRLRGQVLAVAFVIGAGVATLVMSFSTVEALYKTSDAYYKRYRFGDVFADLTRGPEGIAQHIKRIEGVQTVQTRISRFVTVDIDTFIEPVLAVVVSIPEHRQPYLNQLVIGQGEWIQPNRENEVILAEPFAEAHNLVPGDEIKILLNGRKRPFKIVATALSPEFVYTIAPGALLPDDHRFGTMWMSRQALEAAFDLDGAFNNVSLSLLPNANGDSVRKRLDNILKPYGGTNAVLRKDQISNWFVMNEIAQQRTMGKILPGIFMMVAIFLTHMIIGRLITTERTEIGLLKAFGYSKLSIAWHYIKLVVVICVLGILIGWAIGMWFGYNNAKLYAQMYRFPLFIYTPDAYSFSLGAFTSLAAALLGALMSVRRAVNLLPAEAMMPPSPPMYKKHNFFDISIFFKKSRFWSRFNSLSFDQSTRIALRQINRWPIRAFLTSLGFAASVALVVMNLQWFDSLNYLSHSYFTSTQRQDLMIGLFEKQNLRAIHDFEHLPGVMYAEPARSLSADFRVGRVTHRGVISALLPSAKLQPIFDERTKSVIPVPDDGLVIDSTMAKKLDVQLGEMITVEILEGRRPTLKLPVTRIIETYIGMPVYLNIHALSRLMKEKPKLAYANLVIDQNQKKELFSVLKKTPMVSAVMIKQAAVDAFNKTIIEHLMVFISMFTLLAAILSFGVAYNSARIALSERGRELATLRVLGFTRREISYVLLSEVAMLALSGAFFGCFGGWALVMLIGTAFNTELFRVPMVIEMSTYGKAVLIVLAAAVLSAALVRRRVDKLDLIRVLKTRE